MSSTTTQQLAEQHADDSTHDRHSPRGKYKRTHYFVARRTQVRMALELVVLWLVGASLAIMNLYVLHKLGDLYWSDTLQSDYSTWVDNAVVWTYSVSSLVIAVVVFLLACVYYSHRIAGPALKLTRSLDGIADGDLRTRVKLRKSDHLKDVADAVNGVTLRWDNAMAKIHGSVQSIKGGLENEEAKDLLEHCRAIEEILQGYKFKAD